MITYKILLESTYQSCVKSQNCVLIYSKQLAVCRLVWVGTECFVYIFIVSHLVNLTVENLKKKKKPKTKKGNSCLKLWSLKQDFSINPRRRHNRELQDDGDGKYGCGQNAGRSPPSYVTHFYMHWIMTKKKICRIWFAYKLFALMSEWKLLRFFFFRFGFLCIFCSQALQNCRIE